MEAYLCRCSWAFFLERSRDGDDWSDLLNCLDNRELHNYKYGIRQNQKAGKCGGMCILEYVEDLGCKDGMKCGCYTAIKSTNQMPALAKR